MIPMPLNGLTKICIEVLRKNINIEKNVKKFHEIEDAIAKRQYKIMNWKGVKLPTAFLTNEEIEWLKSQYENII
jgi:hypothetical protein